METVQPLQDLSYRSFILKFNTDTETDRHKNLKKFKNGRHDISIKISEELQNMVSCMILMLLFIQFIVKTCSIGYMGRPTNNTRLKASN